ncbi:MAG TPA: NAD(P)H-dependent oxidoreductase [Mycobacteriales bacterium]
MSVLYVNSSPRGPRSESGRIAEALLAALVDTAPSVPVDRMDLFADPLPAFAQNATEAKMAVIGGAAPTGAAADAWAAIRRTAERVTAADTLLFTVPMWNGSIPWPLKLFIDTVTQPGLAFSFDPGIGYSGLLAPRSAITVYTSQVYEPGADARFGVDHQSTYFESWLRLVGLAHAGSIRLQTTYAGRPDLPQARAAALAEARRLGTELGRTAVAA